MPKEWIKLHVNRWLHGSTRDELTPAQRSVWVDLLALAGQYSKDDQEEMVLSISRPALCRLFKVTRNLLDTSLEKFEEHGKITMSDDDIVIINWGVYNPSRQLISYHHKAGFDAPLQPLTELPRREEKRKEKKRREKKTTVVAVQGTDNSAKPNIFKLYEENIGLLSPIIGEQLKEAETVYSGDWIEDAFKEALTHNKRSWRYISAILERWGREGKDDGKPGRHYKGEVDPGKYFKGRYGHLVRR